MNSYVNGSCTVVTVNVVSLIRENYTMIHWWKQWVDSAINVHASLLEARLLMWKPFLPRVFSQWYIVKHQLWVVAGWCHWTMRSWSLNKTGQRGLSSVPRHWILFFIPFLEWHHYWSNTTTVVFYDGSNSSTNIYSDRICMYEQFNFIEIYRYSTRVWRKVRKQGNLGGHKYTISQILHVAVPSYSIIPVY